MKRLLGLLRRRPERSPDHDFPFSPLFSLRLRGLL